MSLLFGRHNRDLGDTSTQLTPPRSRSYGSTTVSADSALRMSAVWACLRLRADIVSALPVDAYRNAGGVQLEVPLTPFLQDPAADGHGTADWMSASQFELDRTGNNVGIIKARDGLGFPSIVELAANSRWAARGVGPVVNGWTINGQDYLPKDVWHERAFPVAGHPLSLSPMAYAAMTIGTYLSAQQFGLDWFSNGTIPSGRLKNNQRAIDSVEAQVAKDRFKAAVSGRDLFVHGSEWEYDPISATANDSQFLETLRWNAADVCRFFGVPADLVDAGDATSGSKIVYANITQRNLQLLIMNLGPAITRREFALSKTLAKPRFVKLNTDALLRMDPATRQTVMASRINSRTLAVTEARALDNLPPLTPDQEAEFVRLFGPPKPPAPTSTPSEGVPA